MRIIRLFFLSFVLISLSTRAAESARTFSPAPGIQAVVTVNGQILTWKIGYGHGNNRGQVDVDTEKSIHIDVNDYDFSGRLGFVVWHVDDGMGVYSVYRVFTFAPSINEFVERSPASLCGDEFINLRVDKKERRLLSTFWNQNIPKVCVTRLSPLK